MSLLQIVGGNVFDALHGDVIRHSVVCIEGDRITAVGSASAIPTGGRDVQVLDAAGQFVLPGMMDCHVHLLSSGAADPHMRDLESRLRVALGTRVALTKSKNGGRIVIRFHNDDELEGLIGRLTGGS